MVASQRVFVRVVPNGDKINGDLCDKHLQTLLSFFASDIRPVDSRRVRKKYTEKGKFVRKGSKRYATLKILARAKRPVTSNVLQEKTTIRSPDLAALKHVGFISSNGHGKGYEITDGGRKALAKPV